MLLPVALDPLKMQFSNKSDLAATRRLLGVRGKGPSHSGAADQRNQLAGPHIGSQTQTTNLHLLKGCFDRDRKQLADHIDRPNRPQ
jgi:hypothetical protein